MTNQSRKRQQGVIRHPLLMSWTYKNSHASRWTLFVYISLYGMATVVAITTTHQNRRKTKLNLLFNDLLKYPPPLDFLLWYWCVPMSVLSVRSIKGLINQSIGECWCMGFEIDTATPRHRRFILWKLFSTNCIVRNQQLYRSRTIWK